MPAFLPALFFFRWRDPLPLWQKFSPYQDPLKAFLFLVIHFRLGKKYYKTRTALEVTFNANSCVVLTLAYYLYDSRKNWGKFMEKERREMWKWPLVLRWVYIERWNATCAQGMCRYPRPQGDGCAQSNKEVPALGDADFFQH